MTTDIVIVGAGAAGIAAGRWLEQSECRPLLLEARSRVGGRAWTDVSTFGFPVDMGCAWLHSADRNPWTQYAKNEGFDVVERSPVWRRRIGREEPSATYRAEWLAAREHYEALIAQAARRGVDVAVAALLPQDRHRPSFDAIMTWLMGTESDRVSSLDYARYGDSDVNWAVTTGLGAVVAHAATSLDIRLDSAVRLIDMSGATIRVTTDTGTVEARAVIVTAPTNVLASGAIQFVPNLPPQYAEAFAGVPLGVANKVFLRLAPGAMPFEGTEHFVGTDVSARTASYATRPAGQDVLLAYLGGTLATELEKRGELASFVREELGEIFGAEFVLKIRASLCTAWSTDPWALGSYSVALPGKAHLRSQLGEPLQERLFFAGEACSLEFFGTVHGAWFSGVSAAEKALAHVRSH
jgi:monoamine oxidase